MEITLTADWIFLHNSEVHCNENAECYVTLYEEFDYYLAELALETMKNVKFECQELFATTDIDYKNPFYRFYIIDIKEVEDSCPQLYFEFEKELQKEAKRQKDIDAKQDIILKFLVTPRTLNQIHFHLETEFYKKKEDYERCKSSLISHTEYTIHELMYVGLIKFENEKYSLL